MTVEAPPGGESGLGAQSRNERSRAKAVWPWLVVQQWIAANTFDPTWIPRQWQRPAVGYSLAVLAELLAVGAAAGLIQVFPTFAYPGIIPLLAIASVALAWGAGPSLAATVVGAAGLDLVVLPLRFIWHLDSLDDVVDVGLFVVVGIVIAAGASRTARARRTAQDLADQLDAGCERIGIVAVDEETGVVRPVAAAGLPPVQEQQWREQLEQTALHEYLGDPALISRLKKDEVVLLDRTPLPLRVLPHPSTARRFLVAPLRVGTHLMGVLTVDNGDAERGYTSVDRALVRAAAKTVALVLERERLLRERAEARAQEWALREANQRMDEFVSLAAHELKTPLAAIQGFVELAHHHVRWALSQDGMMAREVAARCGVANDMLERAEQRSRHLTRLMNDLLDVSRIQAGHLEMRQDICDLAEIVRTCIDTQRLVWPRRTITLDEPPEAVYIRGDADRIGQVVTNYVTNALKYSAADQPVAVILRLQDTEAYVQVRDQGPGLTVEQQTHIWERYRRVQGVAVQDKTLGAGASLGLGLYISRTIIEQHGGRVGVESRPSTGSTFWFALPLVR
jgi:signal transduction histidine kinase